LVAYDITSKPPGGGMRKTMIVALARKLLVALWSFVRTGEVPSGIVL
jgi:transposase